MADPQPRAGTDLEEGNEPGRKLEGEPVTGTPRWVKVAAGVAVALVVVLVIMLIAGIGNHGPGRHSLADTARDHAPRLA
jgi:hypothetical protein